MLTSTAYDLAIGQRLVGRAALERFFALEFGQLRRSTKLHAIRQGALAAQR
jgi:hypothetical protein